MKLTYRPEIDGLRAIAVVAVVLYHAQITILGHQPFSGGFIGVDIFFVISGYLITSIILKELVTTGTFSFKHFYERRVRRILPALLFVMLVSLPFAWMYLLPNSFVDFSKSILSSLGFSSNVYFYYTGQQYGAETGLLKPFLHTWSLSVEEQFYILFPIVLLITFKYFRKYLIHILILGFFISLGLADWGSRNHPSFNFYVLPTRVWELLAGSILAYFEITLGHRNKNKSFNLILPSIGLFLIGHSILFFNHKMFHPSFYTLSPIIGVCLIIWFSNKDELITKILSTKLFVGLGLISYSLYLWHYPIFAFARVNRFIQDNIINEIIIVLGILILSIISYYFIEKPFRNKKNAFKILSNLIVVIAFTLVIINLNIIFKEGYKNRVPEILNKKFSEPSWKLLKSKDGKICLNKIEGCHFNIDAKKNFFLIGDSHMASIMFDLKDKIVKKNYKFITLTYNSCMYFPEFDLIDKKTKKKDKFCNNDYFQRLKKTLSRETNSIIVFGGNLPVYLSGYHFSNKEKYFEDREWHQIYVSVGKYENIYNSFKNEIIEISKKNKIILIYPIPELSFDPNLKILNQWIDEGFPEYFDVKNITTSYQMYRKRTDSSFRLLDSIQGENIYRVYPHKLFCNIKIKNLCVTHDKKNVFYIDNNHLSLTGAEMINSLIKKEIEKIELESN